MYNGGVMNQNVGRAAEVKSVAGDDLFGDDRTADGVATFNQNDFVACICKVSATDEGVVSGAHDHNITIEHVLQAPDLDRSYAPGDGRKQAEFASALDRLDAVYHL